MTRDFRTAICALGLGVALASGCGDATGPAASITISATVGGHQWHPTGGPGTPAPWAMWFEGAQVLSASAMRSFSRDWDQLGFTVSGVHGPGSYPLADPSSGSYGTYVTSHGFYSDPDYTVTYYWTSATAVGAVVVTQFDSTTHAVAGTFTFTAESSRPGEQIIVSSGTFTGHYEARP